MIMDAFNLFSQAQAVTASAASTNVLDLKALGSDLGTGQPLYVVALVTAPFTDTGSDSTVTVTLETDDNEAFASPVTRMTMGTFAAGSLAGSRLIAALPVGVNFERYLRAYFTVAGGNLTTGAISCFIVLDADLYRVYPQASAILG